MSYLGEKISILPWQMAEQLAVEVDVKNVTDGTRMYGQTDTGQAPLFGRDSLFRKKLNRQRLVSSSLNEKGRDHPNVKLLVWSEISTI